MILIARPFDTHRLEVHFHMIHRPVVASALIDITGDIIGEKSGTRVTPSDIPQHVVTVLIGHLGPYKALASTVYCAAVAGFRCVVAVNVRLAAASNGKPPTSEEAVRKL